MTDKDSLERTHPVRVYLEKVTSQDLEEYPEWDLTVLHYSLHQHWPVICNQTLVIITN